ncbi:MAG: ABC transporter substrate-binding protein, partial [Deltaproteobacteria bacterium]|nr:ABC transporter substrate-binding protein [Deltaproteobacteria bacterium]
MFKLVPLLFACLMALPSVALAQDNTLKVGTDCDYAPYSSKDAQGNLVGFEIDLATEVAKRLGKVPQFVCIAFESAIPALNTHQFDVLFDTLSINEERLKQVDFTIPYRADTARFGTKALFDIEPFDSQGKPNLEGLKGKVIGLQAATVYENYIAKYFPGIEVKLYDKLPNMYEDLKTGRVDLVIASTSNI